jgi:hypothetical protein
MSSPLGKNRCSYCDGTEGGNPPTIEDCADLIEELEAELAACKKYRDAYAECDRIATQAVRDLEAKLADKQAAIDHFYKGRFTIGQGNTED